MYRRHDNCSCVVTYENGRKRQDVWSKKSWESPETNRSEYKPKVFERDEASTLEKKNLQFKGVDKTGESGIISSKEKGVVPRINTDESYSELGKFKQKIILDERMDKEYYDTLKEKFSHGSDTAKAVFNKFVPENSVENSMLEGAAYYDPNTKKISMHYGADLKNERGACATWFHEHGHLIDDMAGSVSHNADFSKILHDDYLSYMKSYGKEHGLKTFNKIQNAISLDLSEMREHSAVSDLLNGISKGNIQGIAGHRLSYWKDDSVICEEAFAHMFEAQFDDIRYNEMKKYFPNALSNFENILKGLI